MNLTKADVARLGRREQQPTKREGDLFALFVAGKLPNALNGSYLHWAKHRRLFNGWKARTHQVVLEAAQREGWTRERLRAQAATAKHVLFLWHTARVPDLTGLVIGSKPVQDALVDMDVIHRDDMASGHRFEFDYHADPARGSRRGVEIRVRLLPTVAVQEGDTA